MSRDALTHWDTVRDDHFKLIRFIEWLEGMDIWMDIPTGTFKTLDEEKPSRIIDKYLEVDRKQLEIERRALYE